MACPQYAIQNLDKILLHILLKLLSSTLQINATDVDTRAREQRQNACTNSNYPSGKVASRELACGKRYSSEVQENEENTAAPTQMHVGGVE